MFINIYLYSKNYKSLKNFFLLFQKLSKDNTLKIKKNLDQFKNKKKKKIFTILKSPHVNKRGQDHFEYCLYKKQISIHSFQIFKILIIFKKMQLKLFADVKIKIKFILNIKKLGKKLKKQLNSNEKFFKFKLNNSLKSFKIITFYLTYFDIYGEIAFKNIRGYKI